MRSALQGLETEKRFSIRPVRPDPLTNLIELHLVSHDDSKQLKGNKAILYSFRHPFYYLVILLLNAIDWPWAHILLNERMNNNKEHLFPFIEKHSSDDRF